MTRVNNGNNVANASRETNKMILETLLTPNKQSLVPYSNVLYIKNRPYRQHVMRHNSMMVR